VFESPQDNYNITLAVFRRKLEKKTIFLLVRGLKEAKQLLLK